MLKRIAALTVVIMFFLCLAGCGGNDPADSVNPAITDAMEAAGSSEGGVLHVSVTFDAMKEFAEAVGNDKAEINTIIPDGMEPHDFEPKARDLTALSKADVFVYNGLGMEAWVDGAINAVNNPKLITVEASKGAEAIQNTESQDSSAGIVYDPHLWLSVTGAKLEAQNIKDGFIKADPGNKEYYEKNCANFTSQLDSLYNEYKGKFQSVPKKSFVTGHAAFAYLCMDFGLEQKSVEDTFADGEPTAQQLAGLVKYCRDNSVTTIFAENMVSPAVSQTLADEVGAVVETIYTIESNEDGLTYLERISYDLSKIFESLKTDNG